MAYRFLGDIPYLTLQKWRFVSFVGVRELQRNLRIVVNPFMDEKLGSD